MSQIASPPPPVAQRADRTILKATAVRKTFRMGDSTVQVLKHADVTIRAGEFLAIEGRSGSGKSTLLHILGALDAADDGRIEYEGQDIARMSGTERSRLRNTQFGFVFQFYHLLPELNVLENAALASMIEHSWLRFLSHKREIHQRAVDILKQLGMDHRLKHRPNQLSGGERQRVAIARALMNQPKVLFADEPTGNLDAETGKQIMAVLETLHRERGQTIVMVTHDRTVAKKADRVLVLKDGKLEKPQE
ncbi:MAG TPA: ABC transporter ATP-binding protein [Tepidisphaeraceae bacterium]|nr:ABC transporter ATP-binding protein [Tepidisphaeraceae bacterium]